MSRPKIFKKEAKMEIGERKIGSVLYNKIQKAFTSWEKLKAYIVESQFKIFPHLVFTFWVPAEVPYIHALIIPF
jgi:hypothetical protein